MRLLCYVQFYKADRALSAILLQPVWQACCLYLCVFLSIVMSGPLLAETPLKNSSVQSALDEQHLQQVAGEVELAFLNRDFLLMAGYYHPDAELLVSLSKEDPNQVERLDIVEYLKITQEGLKLLEDFKYASEFLSFKILADGQHGEVQQRKTVNFLFYGQPMKEITEVTSVYKMYKGKLVIIQQSDQIIESTLVDLDSHQRRFFY